MNAFARRASVFLRGFFEARGDAGMTYDNDPESPRSHAYDMGRTLFRRVTRGRYGR